MIDSSRKHLITCAGSQRDEETDSEDEESYSEDEESYGEDEESYGEDEESNGEDEESYGEDGEDEESNGEDEESYGEDEKSYGEDEKSYGEDGEDEESNGEDDESDQEDDEDDESDQEDEDSDGEDEDIDEEDEEVYGEDEEDEEVYGEDEEVYGEDEEVYGEDEEDEEVYGEDEDDEVRDSGDGTEGGVSMSTGRTQAQDLKDVSSVNNSRKRTFEDRRRPPVSLRGGLLNVQSMNNKTLEVLDVIKHNDLDVLCTTETWLERHSGHRVLREASPRNFSFYYRARPSRGGGVAIQFFKTLKHRTIRFNCRITTFEVVAAALQHHEWDEPVLIINVYRPPGSNTAEFHTFLDQFEELLTQALEQHSSIVVTGDFNIRADPEIRSYTDEFLWLLPNYELVQHVRGPTHEAGHTLDLVLTRNVEISRLDVRDERISDHYSVYFNMRPKATKDSMDRNEQVKRFKYR